MRLIEDLFDMGGGYVLDFCNRTFAEFFAIELGVDIDDPKYSVEGSSKAKRLRYFLGECDPGLQACTLLLPVLSGRVRGGRAVRGLR
jgi:hypothetical protein